MSWFDITNALFEIGGGIAVWLDVREIVRDKQAKGIHPWAMGFFTAWAIWNMFYYFHLSQWFSFWADIPLAVGDVVWFSLMLRSRRTYAGKSIRYDQEGD